MTKFTIDISDTDKLAGITGARQAYNAALPEVMDGNPDNPQPISPKPGTLATDAEYVQMVMDSAAESYARSYAPAIVTAKVALDAAVATIADKFNPKTETLDAVKG